VLVVVLSIASMPTRASGDATTLVLSSWKATSTLSVSELEALTYAWQSMRSACRRVSTQRCTGRGQKSAKKAWMTSETSSSRESPVAVEYLQARRRSKIGGSGVNEAWTDARV
jgi:hypothetical protein